jgi:CDP-diacylglycerol--glycerol-3-phosphate 3-phosphatidyltransferase
MTVRGVFEAPILTVPNVLTAARVGLVPLFWWALARTADEPGHYLPLLVVAAVVLTDLLDGYLARRLNSITPFGQYLDPVADKIAILAGLALLAVYRDYPVWVLVLVAAREALGIWLGAFLLIKRRVLGRPNLWGKAGVALLALSGVFYLMEWPHKDWTVWPVVVALVGGVAAYARRYWRLVFGGAEAA